MITKQKQVVNTEPQQVVKFEYQQSLSFTSGTGKSWSEELAVSVRILSEAFSSGWYREMFGKDAKSFIVLMTIVMHARPLRGDDLELLIRLGMATEEDQGRLYARVTDMGLADELGIHRDTVAACAQKLADEKGLIHIGQIPPEVEFRDSHGQFTGSKIYLVAGNLNQMLQKAVNHRAEIFRTVEPGSESTPLDDSSSGGHRAEKFDTVESTPHASIVDGNRTDTHRAENFRTVRAEKPGTNIDSDSDSDVVGVNGVAADFPPVLAYFAQQKNTLDYQPTEKEIAGLKALLADGFDVETEILPGIDQAFEKASSPIRSFTYCVRVIRETRKTKLLERAKRDQEAADLAPSAVPADLAEAAQILTEAVNAPDRATLVRLKAMAAQCEAAAQAEDATGGEWVADAILESLGQANPQHLLSYARKVLQGWTARGRCKVQAAALPEAELPAEITIFQQVTGRIPLRDQVEMVARAIRENDLMAAYLKPFWEEWVLRDKRRTDLTWLTWAIKGEIPDGNGNGRKTSGVNDILHSLAMAAQRGGGE